MARGLRILQSSPPLVLSCIILHGIPFATHPRSTVSIEFHGAIQLNGTAIEYIYIYIARGNEINQYSLLFTFFLSLL